jgi:hypothetical protein
MGAAKPVADRAPREQPESFAAKRSIRAKNMGGDRTKW